MIIDAHHHIFPPLGTGEEAEVNVRLLQYQSRTVRSFCRKENRSWVHEPLLAFPSDDMSDMPDVDFRMGNYGQAEVTIDGVDYYAQINAPDLVGNEASPERMVAEMDRVGVDMGVLQSDHIYGGTLNEYFGECMRQYPGRFIGLAQIWESAADQAAQHARLERAVLEQGSKGLYFSVEPFGLNNWQDRLDEAKYEPLWNVVRKLEIPVWWFILSRRNNLIASYMEHVAELDRWVESHPDIPAVLTHGIHGMDRDRGLIPDEIMTLLKRPNMHVEVLFQAFWPEYPYPGAQEMLKRLSGEVGVDRLMWGTDMPYGVSWCTYKQALDYIRVHCDFLTQEEKGLILGGNAARMFRIEGT